MDLSSQLPKCKSKLNFKRFPNFSSSGKFVTGNNDGSLCLFNGSKLIKTKKLGDFIVNVDYFNGQIVAAANEKLTIMNESLGVIKEYPGVDYEILALCGNATYLAFGEYDGLVRYYKRNSDAEAKVIFLTCSPNNY